MKIGAVEILKDRLSFQPDEITAGTIVLDGETVQWELAKPGPQARNNDTGFGDWTTYFEKDKQVIHPDESTHRYLLRYARQLSVTEAADIYNAIVWALQEKVHPDHCHCQPCETYHDEVIVLRMIALLRGEFPDVERCTGSTDPTGGAH